jgi:spore coat polysaccharide biosynthesis predicted glycosyltransferase SpsG
MEWRITNTVLLHSEAEDIHSEHWQYCYSLSIRQICYHIQILMFILDDLTINIDYERKVSTNN